MSSTNSSSTTSSPATSAPTQAADQALFPDFFSFGDNDIFAPHPDLFESELDSSLAQFDEADFNLENLDLLAPANDPFAFLRSDTPTFGYRATGPGSAVTASSAESASASGYESLSSYSESFYNPSSTYSFPVELDMDFQRIRVDPLAEYAAAAAAAKTSPILTPADLTAVLVADAAAGGGAFALLPASPAPQHRRHSHISPQQLAGQAPNGLLRTSGDVYSHQRSRSGAYSDYIPSAPVVRSTGTSEYYPSHNSATSRHSFSHQQPRTVSPSSVSSTDMSTMSMPITPPIPLFPALRADPRDSASIAIAGGDDSDGRKKYKCPSCPRSFARAFNLKTHMATHDPHRPKPHVCPHKACGRSFSRKHDLGRHLVSIHREDQAVAMATAGVIAAASVGVGKGPRGWCEDCGKGWIGRDMGCNCDEKPLNV